MKTEHHDNSYSELTQSPMFNADETDCALESYSDIDISQLNNLHLQLNNEMLMLNNTYYNHFVDLVLEFGENDKQKIYEVDQEFISFLKLEYNLFCLAHAVELSIKMIRNKTKNNKTIQLNLTEKLEKSHRAALEDKLLYNRFIAQHKEYVKFKSAIHDNLNINLSHDNDNAGEDIVMKGSKKSLKCPITSNWLEDPVSSLVCKHSYSKQPLKELLKRNREQRITCPVPGCSYYITINDVRKDSELELLVIKQKQEELA